MECTDAIGPEFFEREGFESTALEFVMSGFAAEVGDQFVGDVNGQIHYSTLAGREARVTVAAPQDTVHADTKKPATQRRGLPVLKLRLASKRSSCRAVP